MKLRLLKILTSALTIIWLLTPAVYSDVAQTSSGSYQLSEVFMGAGGQLNACSASYCSKQSAGETTVGNPSSPNYQLESGFNSNRSPYIQMVINSTSTNLGTLKPSATATANATFSVETYLAHGYQVVNASTPPNDGTYTMQTPSSPTTSQAGTEQFGINLVANTNPINFGANPSYIPSSQFSYGIVDSSYDTPNEYMYANGSTIALSTKSTSYTQYTISYIFNISHVTPGGTYTFNHVLVATSTY